VLFHHQIVLIINLQGHIIGGNQLTIGLFMILIHIYIAIAASLVIVITLDFIILVLKVLFLAYMQAYFIIVDFVCN